MKAVRLYAAKDLRVEMIDPPAALNRAGFGSKCRPRAFAAPICIIS